MDPQILEKLTLLAEGAKYDVSCSSSGVGRRNQGGLGSASSAGICHSWSRDGRCISLLKVLLSNRCVYDCAYCVNRRSNSIPRAAFEPKELAELTFSFYRRNYIEGLFLSSAVDGSPDQTAERMVESLRLLRREYSFGGYIHAKIIPGTDPLLVHQLGLLADRLSINLEVPSPEGLARLAPQKKPTAIFSPMRQITGTLMEQLSLRPRHHVQKQASFSSRLFGWRGFLFPPGGRRRKGEFPIPHWQGDFCPRRTDHPNDGRRLR